MKQVSKKKATIKNRLLKLSIGLAAGASLTACGGGTTGSVPAGHTISAQFVDAPVENLHYDSLSNMGDTDANGRFNCTLGEEVSFSIGKLTLGKSICQRIVTPQTISATITQTTVPQTTTSASGVVLSNGTKTQSTITATAGAHDPEVINRVRLLMSLDTDGDATNGIQLPKPAEQQKDITQTTMDFKHTNTFDSEAASMIGQIPAGVIKSNSGLRSATEATTHFDQTLTNDIPNITTTTTNGNGSATPTKIGSYYDDNTGTFNETKLESEHNTFTEKGEAENGQQEIQGR